MKSKMTPWPDSSKPLVYDAAEQCLRHEGRLVCKHQLAEVARRCNSHAALVEALQTAYLTLGALGGHTAKERDTAIVKARAALALAGIE